MVDVGDARAVAVALGAADCNHKHSVREDLRLESQATAGLLIEALVHPCENQKQDWPALHSEVPLLHEQVYGSIVPLQCMQNVSEK